MRVSSPCFHLGDLKRAEWPAKDAMGSLSLEEGKRASKALGVQAPAVIIRRWRGKVRGDDARELRWRVGAAVGEVAGVMCVAV